MTKSVRWALGLAAGLMWVCAQPASAVQPTDERAQDAPPRIAVLTLEGIVGLEITAQTLRKCVPLLEEEGAGVVVLRVNSGRGTFDAVEAIHKVLVEEYKPRFRTVGWIESAGSAGAAATYVLEELYFTPRGSFGPLGGFLGSGGFAAPQTRLEDAVRIMQRASREGLRDPKIMWSMQLDEPLSATIDQAGSVQWFQSTEGEHLLNSRGNVLRLDAPTAERFGVSEGTASSLGELARAMGYSVYKTAGQKVDGAEFAVSKAEQHLRDRRDKVRAIQPLLKQSVRSYYGFVHDARSAAEQVQRLGLIDKARSELKRITAFIEEVPDLAMFEIYVLPEQMPEWLRECERDLNDLSELD